jgi:hypothetical protein
MLPPISYLVAILVIKLTAEGMAAHVFLGPLFYLMMTPKAQE